MEFLAKSQPQETIRQHTDKVLQKLERIFALYGDLFTENEKMLLRIPCKYHDYGKIIDETTYQRNEKHINIDNVINIDFLQKVQTLHEVKKSRKIEEAGILQVKYYLYYLKLRGVHSMKGKIDYPLLRSSITVELTPEDENHIELILTQIEDIITQSVPPDCVKKGICKNCVYHDLCFI